MLKIYAITLAGLVLGQLAPGPNLLAVASVALGKGREHAVLVALGVAIAVFGWVAIAALGLATLLVMWPSLLIAMKLLGGAYLCFLALRALAAALRGGAPALAAAGSALTAAGAVRRGILVNLTNPKSALMWAAIATFLFGSGLSAPQVLGFAPLAFVSALAVYGAYALLLSSPSAQRIYGRFARSLEASFAAGFGVLGGRLVTDGLGEMAR